MVIGDEIWQRFNEKNRESHRWYLAGILDGLQDLKDLAAFQELERLYQLVYEPGEHHRTAASYMDGVSSKKTYVCRIMRQKKRNGPECA